MRRAARLGQSPVRLDAEQLAVLAATEPVVRVLGGPGTGSTTLAVELVVDRVHRVGLHPEQCLLLAPTRLAAAALRERVTTRLAGTVTEPLARTPLSFAFAVLRREAALRGDPGPRLLNGPEQDLVLRELLAGHVEQPELAPVWPERVRAALPTRGFRGELRDLLMRAVEHGLDAVELARLGVAHGRPEWVAAARVLDEYDEVTALSRPGAYDPAWIATAATELLDERPDALARVHEQLRLVVVDDAHELTWATARLLRRIAHPGAQVVLLGDPDCAVQTFRGADPGLLWWDQWGELADAPTHVLRAAYRAPEALHTAAARVVRHIGVTGSGAQRLTRPVRAGGLLQVALVRSAAAEATLVADTLRRAHLHDGMPWEQMAVIVRGRARGDILRRVLAGAGIPLAAMGAELPVRDEVAVRPLLHLLELALRWAVDPQARVTPTEAGDLLLSPIGGADAVSLRRLRRHLRRAELDGGGRRTSDEILAALLGDPLATEVAVAGVPEGVPLRRLSRAVAAGVRAAVRREDGLGWQPGVSAETVLWQIWSALELAGTWRAEALGSSRSIDAGRRQGRPDRLDPLAVGRAGSAAARADRDLDAVLGLFDAAARFADRLPLAGPDQFLDHIRGEQVAGDTLLRRAPAESAVELLTPAAAAGRQWRLVCIAGVQEGVWPDLRLRGSLLGSEHLVAVVTGRADQAAMRSAQAAVRYDETRLLLVALTRASERVLVTAVRSDQEQPSPYLDVLDPLDPAGPPSSAPAGGSVLPAGAGSGSVSGSASARAPGSASAQAPGSASAQAPNQAWATEPPTRPFADPPRLLTPAGVVGELRRQASSPDPVLRSHAARLLVALADDGVRGADPRGWWGLVPPPQPRPRRAPGHQVRVSPSKIEQFQTCPLQWALVASGGSAPQRPAARIGTLVHDVLADLGDVEAGALQAEVDRRWPQLGLPPGWLTERLRAEAHDMVWRAARYVRSPEAAGWRCVGVELPLSVDVGAARVTGKVDRLERHTEHGGLRVVDYKTGATKTPTKDVPSHPQLLAYQAAVEAGGFPEHGRVSSGAALLQLGRKARSSGVDLQVQPPVGAGADPQAAHRMVDEVAHGMAAAQFAAIPGTQCDRCPVRTSCPTRPEGSVF